MTQSPVVPSPTLLVTSEAAAELHVSIRTVHRMAAGGILTPLVKLPGSKGAYVFAPAEVARVAAILAQGAL